MNVTKSQRGRWRSWIDPQQLQGAVVAGVLTGVVLAILGWLVPALGWLAAPLATPLWLLLSLVGLAAWLGYLVMRAKRAPIFFEGAYYTADDAAHEHPYCMHCWEHARMLVTVQRSVGDDGAMRLDCVTHGFQSWEPSQG